MVKSRTTRDRLLEVAGEMFAERGYAATTGRDICARAGINPAAVNYYFGGKAALHREVVRCAHQRLVAVEDIEAALARPGTPEERLRRVIHLLLGRLLDREQGDWSGRLIAREMLSPTAALQSLVEEEIRPKSRLLRHALAAILDRDVDDPTVERAAVSVIAQCLAVYQNRPVLRQLFPGLLENGSAALADHVYRFSLGGLKELRDCVNSRGERGE